MLLFNLLALSEIIILGNVVIFEVLVAFVIRTTTTAAATAMIFFEELEVVLVERPRDHPELFQITFIVDFNLTKAACILNLAGLRLAIARPYECY